LFRPSPHSGILSRQGEAKAGVGDSLNSISTRGRDAVITHDWGVELTQKDFHVQGTKTEEVVHHLQPGGVAMVSLNDFFHTPFFGFMIILFIYSLLMSFGVLVNALISRMWGEASDEAATARM
jgi:hypothetical protein